MKMFSKTRRATIPPNTGPFPGQLFPGLILAPTSSHYAGDPGPTGCTKAAALPRSYLDFKVTGDEED